MCVVLDKLIIQCNWFINYAPNLKPFFLSTKKKCNFFLKKRLHFLNILITNTLQINVFLLATSIIACLNYIDDIIAKVFALVDEVHIRHA